MATMSPTNPFARYAIEKKTGQPQEKQQRPSKNPFFEMASKPEEESGIKSFARTSVQPAIGYAQGTPYGLATNLSNFLSMGEVYDPEEIDRIRAASEKAGIPFDEEKYMEAARQALGSFPTPGNIAHGIEETTGLPLDPKTWYDRALSMGFTAGRAQPGAISQKVAAGVTAPAVSGALGAAGVPEPFAELAGYAAGGLTGAKTPQAAVSLGKTKPSGIKERGFESLKDERKVSPSKLEQINKKVKDDFKDISDKIIMESPVGETAEALRNDPQYKQASRELLNQAQEIADTMPQRIPTEILKKEIVDTSIKKAKGISLSEHEKEYYRFVKDKINDLNLKDMGFGQLVEQYRKNNSDLSEYYEPGRSSAYNRAKKEALLDYNRGIASLMKKIAPESELVPIFEEGNARWSKIKDIEAIDEFVGDIFPIKEGKETINYKKMHKFLDENGYDFIFKRALGEKGFKDFEQLMVDMIAGEKGHSKLSPITNNFWKEIAKTGFSFWLHPAIGGTKIALSGTKKAYSFLLNSLLDKPKLSLNIKRGFDAAKKGDLPKSEKEFKTVAAELNTMRGSMGDFKVPGEEINVKAERIKPSEKSLYREEPNLLEAPKKQIEQHFPKEEPSEIKLEQEGREFRDRFMQKETGNEVRDLEGKNKKTGEKPKKHSVDEILDMDYKYNPEKGRQEFVTKEKKPPKKNKMSKNEEDHLFGKNKISEKLPKAKKGEYEVSIRSDEGFKKEKKKGEIFDNLFAISKKGKYSYDINHVPTGWKISGFEKKKQAIDFLHKIYEEKPFNDIENIFSKDPDTASMSMDKNRIAEIIREVY